MRGSTFAQKQLAHNGALISEPLNLYARWQQFSRENLDEIKKNREKFVRTT
jgi:hypothetical protein